jgi:predicted transcriptional regulator
MPDTTITKSEGSYLTPSLEHATVADAMHPGILSCERVVEPDTSLRDAAQEMLGRGVSHAVVTDPVAQRPVGVLSTLDLAGVLAWGEA